MPNPKVSSEKISGFSSFFADLKDPRRTHQGNRLYPLEEILFLCIAAVISGADTWTSINLFGKSKLDWLKKWYPYENGIPSHDVLGKVFAALEPGAFSRCFISWVNSIADTTRGEVVAIDGKTICRSDDKGKGKSAIHVVSAFASENGLCLGQLAVASKSNEITAIPELLELLALKGCTVTIDAMGCQKNIAKTIVEKDADYILMVKGNQKGLRDQIEKLFSIKPVASENKDSDLGHGRIEHRKCEVINQLNFLDDRQEWVGLKSVIRITSERISKDTGKGTTQIRYYISSLDTDAKSINRAVRSHWSVENKLHWVLDVVFKEDASLKKKDNSALNYNIIAKMALTLMDREKSTKKSKPSKRLLAALDDNYRDKILRV
ncbi:Mobile element protein [Fulvivirga imtechensis AK7]|uniref:Mobile element protein n=1 Tax=Fulvivirga imtechensis AK7 TaxID=1237149 RepID=L8JXF4_9BACT|nr:ISAs1 family transposase [Fulvivirga imtechensis]ELR72294.1 Mobile element protein [Fulvivirga imtechensis AK7]